MANSTDNLPRLPHSEEAERALLGGIILNIWPLAPHHSTSAQAKTYRALQRQRDAEHLRAEVEALLHGMDLNDANPWTAAEFVSVLVRYVDE